MPVVGFTCSDLLVCFFHLHARLWVRTRTRYSLRPLIPKGIVLFKPGRIRVAGREDSCFRYRGKARRVILWGKSSQTTP
jgi:hypothetical protein